MKRRSPPRRWATEVYTKFPFVTGMRPMNADPAELILNRTWRPALSITGFEGAPRIQDAGNVLRPATSAKLSLRLPPTKDADTAGDALKALLEAEPPYGAKVTFELEKAGTGWDAPPLADWLRVSVNKASQIAFGRDAALMGEGGSIPFMGMLGEKYPEGAVRHHRRPRPSLQRPWPQRVPAHRDGQGRDARRIPGACGSRRPRALSASVSRNASSLP